MRYVSAVALFLFVGNADAAIIAATNFDGRNVAGATASNINWTVNGVADPGNITASHALFDTADAQNKFAVHHNIGIAPLTPWTANIALNVGASAISLTNVTLNAYIINGAGIFQTVGRDLDMSVLLLDAGLNLISTTTINNIYTHGGAIVQPQNANFDLSGNTLSANTNY
ncbi:MAG: hypothetical protein VB853_12580, partial [Pirellulales bacterium]